MISSNVTAGCCRPQDEESQSLRMVTSSPHLLKACSFNGSDAPQSFDLHILFLNILLDNLFQKGLL